MRDGVSTYYLGINRGKRSIALDFRDEADARLARKLARRADVVIENFKPGGLARYGLDHASVSAGNPRVVYASISGFGAGPGRNVPGYDLMVQAISGLMSLTGDPDGPPYRAGISVFDVMAGNHAVIGILAALRHRDATGRGQLVEVNLLSSALTGLVNHSSSYVAGDTAPFRMGNAHPSVFPYEPLPTADQDLIVTAANDGQFRKLCEVLGIPGTADDPRFRHNADRTERREELRPLLLERLRTRSALEWFELLVDAGVPCGPINTIEGGFAMAERFGLDPVIEVGRETGRCPPPGTRSASPRPRPPTACPRPSWTSTGPNSASGSRTDRRTVMPEYPTALGASSLHSITLLGQDLAEDVMGEVGFGELAFWLATQRRPTSGETRVFEAVLAALADHGFTPTAITARLTYLSAPDSIQGAIAAGLLGGGSRFLGVTEDCGRFLHDALATLEDGHPTDEAGWDELALATVRARREAGGSSPASVTTSTNKVTPALRGCSNSPRRKGCSARTWRCSRPSAGSTPRCWAARCRSTAPGCAVPRSPTSAFRWNCSAPSPCSPARPDSSASSPRRCATLSRTTSSCRWT